MIRICQWSYVKTCCFKEGDFPNILISTSSFTHLLLRDCDINKIRWSYWKPTKIRLPVDFFNPPPPGKTNQVTIGSLASLQSCVKIITVFVPILSRPKFTPYFSVQIDLFSNGSEQEGYNVLIGEMLCLVRSLGGNARMRSLLSCHSSGCGLPFRSQFTYLKTEPLIWQDLKAVWSTRLWTGYTALEVGAEHTRITDSESDWEAVSYDWEAVSLQFCLNFFISWRSRCNSYCPYQQ